MADRSTTKTSAARVALTDAKLHGDALDSMPSGAHRAVKETSVSGRDHREETMTDRSVLLGGSVLAGTVPDSATPNQTIQAAKSQTTLPHPEQPFGGRIGRTAKNSTPDFPKGIEAPKDAPNVLLIMTDDVGFGASSTFGGPIQTPNFQRLADTGLRYNTSTQQRSARRAGQL